MRPRSIHAGCAGLALLLIACGGGGGGGSRSLGGSGTTSGGTAASTAPSSLTARAASVSAIQLSWTDNATGELGFTLERQDATASGTWASLVTLAPDTTSHLDTGLAPGTQYTYRVTALGSAGPLGTSNEASAHTIGEFSRQVGSPAFDDARGIAVDDSGSLLAGPVVYTAGRTEGALGVAQGGFDGYLRAYAPDTSVLWTVQFGTPGNDDAFDVARCPQTGDLVVVGRTDGDLGGTNQGSYDVFVARFDMAGNQLWVRQYGSSLNERAVACRIDANGAILVGGMLSDPATGGGQDPFVLKYDAQGIFQWEWLHQQWGNESATDIDIDAAGNVYVIGRAQFTMPGALSAPGSGDIYVAKIDPAGTQQWIAQVGSSSGSGLTGHDLPGNITVLPSGHIFACGFVQGDAAGQGAYRGPAVNSSTKWQHWGDAVVVALDSAGTVIDTIQFGTAEDDYASDVLVGASGALWVVGYTRGDLTGAGSPHGGVDMFIAELDAQGTVVGVDQQSTSDDDYGLRLVAGSSRSFFMCGSTGGDFDGLRGDLHAGDRDPLLRHLLD